MAEPNSTASLNADIRAAVFDVAVQSEGEAMFDELIKAHEDWQKFDFLMKANLAPIFPVSMFGGASFSSIRKFFMVLISRILAYFHTDRIDVVRCATACYER